MLVCKMVGRAAGICGLLCKAPTGILQGNGKQCRADEKAASCACTQWRCGYGTKKISIRIVQKCRIYVSGRLKAQGENHLGFSIPGAC